MYLPTGKTKNLCQIDLLRNVYISFKQKLAPRSPDDLKTNSEFWSFPYRVVTVEDEEILAIGSMLFQKNTLVPRLCRTCEIISFLTFPEGISNLARLDAVMIEVG